MCASDVPPDDVWMEVSLARESGVSLTDSHLLGAVRSAAAVSENMHTTIRHLGFRA